MQNQSRPIDISGIWLFFAGLLICAFISFWPTYFALGLPAHVGYVHFHASAATLWTDWPIWQSFAEWFRAVQLTK